MAALRGYVHGMETRRQGLLAVIVAAVLLFAAACSKEEAEDTASKAKEEAKDVATSVANQVDQATEFKTTLTGAAEVPGPGDPDGSGNATLNLDVTGGKVCYTVTVAKLDPPTAMHIHEGEKGKAGGIVVPLTAPSSGDTTTPQTCTDVDAELMGRITAQPGNFYVNVHTGTYPQGAIRGQLEQ